MSGIINTKLTISILTPALDRGIVQQSAGLFISCGNGSGSASCLLLTSEQDALPLPLLQEVIIAALCWTMPLSSAGAGIVMVSLVLIMTLIWVITQERWICYLVLICSKCFTSTPKEILPYLNSPLRLSHSVSLTLKRNAYENPHKSTQNLPNQL